MHESKLSALLKELSSQYYNHHISFDEYRDHRRKLINKVDQYYNGVPRVEEKSRDTSTIVQA